MVSIQEKVSQMVESQSEETCESISDHRVQFLESFLVRNNTGQSGFDG